jgi:hypothetical protein
MTRQDWFSRRVKLACRELSSIGCEDQRISSVARHSFAGTTLVKRRLRRLGECKPACGSLTDRTGGTAAAERRLRALLAFFFPFAGDSRPR